MKGYRIAITHAETKYATLWRRMLGYKINRNKPSFQVAGHDGEYFELVKELPALNSALTENSDVKVLSRIEGDWDSPSPLE